MGLADLSRSTDEDHLPAQIAPDVRFEIPLRRPPAFRNFGYL
jgi:hypothetical protein